MAVTQIDRGPRFWGKAAPVKVRFRATAQRAGRNLARRITTSRSALMTVAGFGWIDAAVWNLFGTGMGMGAIGVSFLVIESLSGEERP